MKRFIKADCNAIYSIACLLVTFFFIVQQSDSYNTKESHTIVIKPGMPQLAIQTREIKTKVPVNETIDSADNTTCDYELRQIKMENQTIWIETEINYSSERPNTILALSKADERYTLNCSAPYLTRWTSTIIPNLPAKYGHPNRYDHNPFHFEGNGDGTANRGANFSSHFSFMLQNARSGFVQCESVSNASMATKVFFFAQDGSPFVHPLQRKEFQPPIITDTRQPFYVPCIANYPDIVPKLVKVTNRTSCPINHGTEVNISQSQIMGAYDPQLGFRLQGNDIENQHYRCNMGEESDKARRHKNLRITFDLSNPYVNPLTSTINLKFHLGSAEDEYPLGIWCSSKNNTRNEIKMINCNSQYECDWLDACLNFEKCEEHHILQAVPHELNNQPNFQGIITSPFTRGKVVCISSINPAVFAYEYLFLGLDRGRYWLKAQAHEIPKRAIIYMTETESVIYSNKPALFACETSNFVLSSNIKFAAVLKNNTNVLLDKINTTRDPAIFLGNDLGFSRKEILINVTTDFIGIMCLAPWLNSSQWINTTRTFEVRDVKKPFIHPPLNATREGTAQAKAALIIFYKGDKTQSLFCNATGEPRPKIQWFLPSEHDTTLGHYKLEEPTLRFPVIQTNLQGKYNCVATNEHGSDYLVFDVAVETARPGIKTATIVGISGAFLVLLIGLGVAMKKYIDVKKTKRNLTPDEIKEFLYGNPEILKQSTDGTHTEDGIQSMGFNPDYEILSSDLSLDGCQTLGEGQFGKVVQGHLRGNAVAVKTTKPNADVAYFLALLSELKIMAYIANEKHPNIVEFLGAVVSEIEKRKVFVVVELSSMGNMQTFLLKLGSGRFVDLLSQEGSINLDEHTYKEVKCKFSTLNLISWCQQIASGMEFLASKRVIHGDLATRNVLMFDNDVVKITDFGLSRKLYESPQYVKKRGVAMPVAWMAIESLRFMQFSVQSDVWAFAVTVWEIFSMGEIPYAGVPSTDFVKNLMGGMRLERPIYAPNDIHAILLSCWELEPTQRPSFSTLQIFFDEYLKKTMQTLEVENEENSDAVQIVFSETDGIAGSYHSFW